jgi:hypothetical protein
VLTGTRNFSVGQALRASGGSIPLEVQDNAQLVLEWLEAARAYLGGHPIIITNLFRTSYHNAEIAGHASNSQHLRALAADFDVLGLTNHAAAAAIVAGVQLGAIPSYHQLITYTTDHHVHVGLAAESWPDDEQLLLETAVGQYRALDVGELATLAQSATAVDVAATIVAQAGDAAQAYPLVAAAVVAFFLAPAVFGGHWT